MDIVFILLSATGVITSLILILFLFQLKKGNRLGNRLLGVLFLFLTIRIGKATLYYYFDLNERAVYIGLAAFLGIGPVCYLYFTVILQKSQSLRPTHLLHLVPPVVVLISGALLSYKTLSNLQPYLYQTILFYYLLYLGVCYYLCYQEDLFVWNNIKRRKNKFLIHLLGAVTLIYIVYLANWFISFNIYVYGGLFYFVIIYLFLYKSLVDKTLYHELGKVNKFQYIDEDDDNPDKKIAEIEELMKAKKLYRDPNLDLFTTSQELNITKHQLSELINKNFGFGFPAFVNKYRLEDAQEQLVNTDQNISQIAYASGFNSISTFNTLFKKETGKTPTQFRKQKSS